MTLHADAALSGDAVPYDELSDVALAAHARGGDAVAFSALASRHIDAVETLADTMAGPHLAPSVVAATFARARRAVEGVEGPGLSLRTWLLRLTLLEYDGSAPRPAEDAIISTFEDLPAAWQVALWHLAVEGEPAASVAVALGSTPTETVATARRAVAVLRRGVLRRHVPVDLDSACYAFHSSMDTEVATLLPRGQERAFGKHAARCETCGPLAAELAAVTTGLRGTLAVGVLGAGAGEAYLATRPEPLHSVQPQPIGRIAAARATATTNLRPVLATLGAASVAAAAVAVLIGQPAVNPGEVYNADGQLVEIVDIPSSSGGTSGQTDTGLPQIALASGTTPDSFPVGQPIPGRSQGSPTPGNGVDRGPGAGGEREPGGTDPIGGGDGSTPGLPGGGGGGGTPIDPTNPGSGGGSGGGGGGGTTPGGGGGGSTPGGGGSTSPITVESGSGGSGIKVGVGGSGSGDAPISAEVGGSGVKVETPITGTVEVPLPEVPIVTEVVDGATGVVGGLVGGLLKPKKP